MIVLFVILFLNHFDSNYVPVTTKKKSIVFMRFVLLSIFTSTDAIKKTNKVACCFQKIHFKITVLLANKTQVT